MSSLTHLVGFVDDTSALDGNVHEATAARSGSPVVGALLVRDTELPLLRGYAGPLAAVVTGGAGQVAGPAGLCSRTGLALQRLELTARDLADLVGSTRRLVAAVDDARSTGTLGEDVEVRVALPAGPVDTAWLAAADELASADLALTLTHGPGVLAQVDAALDRELPFGVTGVPVDRALPLLGAVVRLFDGVEASSDALPAADDLARGRRWFRSFWAPASAVADLEAHI